MVDAVSRIGCVVRIILISGFHYSGKILDENENTLTILDKFNSQVTLAKNSIEVLEVSNGN